MRSKLQSCYSTTSKIWSQTGYPWNVRVHFLFLWMPVKSADFAKDWSKNDVIRISNLVYVLHFPSTKLTTVYRYKYIRHPSYFGWFYWSIGTQLLLCNPISVVIYTLVGWLFFRRRIAFEEETLQRQYPREYSSYMDCSYIGIPFIFSEKLTGLIIEEDKHAPSNGTRSIDKEVKQS